LVSGEYMTERNKQIITKSGLLDGRRNVKVTDVTDCSNNMGRDSY
jgi:hypothetical protein